MESSHRHTNLNVITNFNSYIETFLSFKLEKSFVWQISRYIMFFFEHVICCRKINFQFFFYFTIESFWKFRTYNENIQRKTLIKASNWINFFFALTASRPLIFHQFNLFYYLELFNPLWKSLRKFLKILFRELFESYIALKWINISKF